VKITAQHRSEGEVELAHDAFSGVRGWPTGIMLSLGIVESKEERR
jgi:hypothetical protein